MEDGQAGVFGDSRVAGVEAEAGRGLALGLAGRLRQEVAAAERRGGDVEAAAGEGAEPLGLAGRLAVDVRHVEVGGILVDLLAGAQPLLAGQGTGEGHADGPARLHVHLGEEGVVAGDGDGPALGVDVGGRVAVAAVEDGVLKSARDGRQRHVVVHKLGKHGRHHRVAPVHVAHILRTDETDKRN